MKIVKHHCSNCDSKFTIHYDELDCEDEPKFCPFCAEYILEEELEQDEDYWLTWFYHNTAEEFKEETLIPVNADQFGSRIILKV